MRGTLSVELFDLRIQHDFASALKPSDLERALAAMRQRLNVEAELILEPLAISILEAEDSTRIPRAELARAVLESVKNHREGFAGRDLLVPVMRPLTVIPEVLEQPAPSFVEVRVPSRVRRWIEHAPESVGKMLRELLETPKIPLGL